MSDELMSLLPAFRLVATTGGFTAASGRLGITPSAVSQKIRQLEALLGVRLFERTSRSVRLTEAGRLLFDSTEGAFRDISEAVDRVRSAGKEPAGTLRINLSRLAAKHCIEPRLLGFIRRYPDIVLELATDDRLTDIVAGGFDAGIRFADTLALDMIARPIGPKLRRVMLASPAYLEAFGAPKAPEELVHHHVIRYRFPGSQRLEPLTFAVNGDTLRLDLPPRLVLDDDDHIHLALQEGLGMAQRFVSDDNAAAVDGLVEVLRDFRPPERQFQLYYPSRNQPPKLQAFIAWFCG